MFTTLTWPLKLKTISNMWIFLKRSVVVFDIENSLEYEVCSNLAKNWTNFDPKKQKLNIHYWRYPNVENMTHILWCVTQITDGLLICTLISENQGLEKLRSWEIKVLRKQGLEKSRSVSNLRKISGPANLDFFINLQPGFFSGLFRWVMVYT